MTLTLFERGKFRNVVKWWGLFFYSIDITMLCLFFLAIVRKGYLQEWSIFSCFGILWGKIFWIKKEFKGLRQTEMWNYKSYFRNEYKKYDIAYTIEGVFQYKGNLWSAMTHILWLPVFLLIVIFALYINLYRNFCRYVNLHTNV